MSLADVDTASGDYARRFTGQIGAWLLSVQARGITELLGEGVGKTALDVGGGHGQSARVLAGLGYGTTILGSEPNALGEARGFVESGGAGFEVSGFDPIAKPDRSYDVVAAFRLLPHYEDWPRLVGEMCRVARETVLIDYPTTQSVNIISDKLFGLKKNIEGNTRTYTLFSRSEVERELGRHGFTKIRIYPQFFFPMVLHRLLKSPRLSSLLESAASILGLRSLLGSPVIVRADRSKQ